jgi:hypothetical protein
MVVRRIQSWHAHGVDVDSKIPVLATYLGHVEVRLRNTNQSSSSSPDATVTCPKGEHEVAVRAGRTRHSPHNAGEPRLFSGRDIAA